MKKPLIKIVALAIASQIVFLSSEYAGQEEDWQKFTLQSTRGISLDEVKASTVKEEAQSQTNFAETVLSPGKPDFVVPSFRPETSLVHENKTPSVALLINLPVQAEMDAHHYVNQNGEKMMKVQEIHSIGSDKFENFKIYQVIGESRVPDKVVTRVKEANQLKLYEETRFTPNQVTHELTEVSKGGQFKSETVTLLKNGEAEKITHYENGNVFKEQGTASVSLVKEFFFKNCDLYTPASHLDPASIRWDNKPVNISFDPMVSFYGIKMKESNVVGFGESASFLVVTVGTLVVAPELVLTLGLAYGILNMGKDVGLKHYGDPNVGAVKLGMDVVSCALPMAGGVRDFYKQTPLLYNWGSYQGGRTVDEILPRKKDGSAW